MRCAGRAGEREREKTDERCARGSGATTHMAPSSMKSIPAPRSRRSAEQRESSSSFATSGQSAKMLIR
jgi:hypothetical protein